MKGGKIMDQITKTNDTCSIFKDGKSNTTTEVYTEAWVKLINLLEQNKHG
jgi:hypothetical protein